MLYLVNKYRNLTATAEETVEIMNEIQSASRCKVGAVVNNSHLKYETTWETVENSLAYAEEIAKLAEVPLWATTIPTFLYKDEKVQALTEQYDSANWYPVEIYVRAPWESGVPEFDKL